MAGLYNADNVMIGHAVGYFQEYDPEADPEWPDDSVELWGDWPAGWQSAGATDEGYSVEAVMETEDHTIEEQASPVAQTVTAAGLVVKAALAEDTMQTVKLAWNGTDIQSTAAASGQPGVDKMTLSSDIKYYRFGLELQNFRGMARRIFVKKVAVKSSDEVAFRRAAGKRTYGIEITSLCAPEEVEVIDITAPALP